MAISAITESNGKFIPCGTATCESNDKEQRCTSARGTDNKLDDSYRHLEQHGVADGRIIIEILRKRNNSV